MNADENKILIRVYLRSSAAINDFLTASNAYPSALPTTMIEKVKSPVLTVSVQSCSPSLTTDGAAAPGGGVSRESTAGCGDPEAFRLILTRSSKAGWALGSGSAATGVNRAKSRCGATPEWAPSTARERATPG